MKLFEKVVSLCTRRGIFFPAYELYGGVAGLFDWGPIGVKIRENFIKELREHLIKEENVYEISSPSFAPEIVWKASGHLESFADVLVKCEKCESSFRADHLIEEQLKMSCEDMSAKEMEKIIREKIRCPNCKSKLGKVEEFNLMFKSTIGPLKKSAVYAKAECAQSIFLNFKRVQRAMRAKLPFGIAEIGRCFRNEISPRNFVFRLREFTLMDLEFFVHPKKKDEVREEKWEKVKGTEMQLLPIGEQEKERPSLLRMSAEDAWERGLFKSKWHAYWIAKIWKFLTHIGLNRDKLRVRQQLPAERAFYSIDTWDIEANFSFGWKEIVGCADRSDYDLKQHQKYSEKDLSYYDEESKEKVIPHVIEPSIGIERPIYALIEHCYREDKGRKWLALPPFIAPYQAAIFPLLEKDSLPEKAREVHALLKDFDVFYDEKGSIGRRYRRADEIGIPFAITIDHKTLQDESVTLRERDSMKQVRVKIERLPALLKELITGAIPFDSLK